MKLLKTLLLFSLLALPNFARAGAYIEPMVGYLQGTQEYTFKSTLGGGTDKGTNNGLAYGAAAGYVLGNGLRFGIDFEMLNTDLKYDTAGTTSKIATTQYFAIVGYKFPQDIVAYLGLGYATAKDDATPQTTLNGMVAKFGGGKELVSHVSVFVDAVAWLWNDYTTGSASSQKIADSYDKFNAVGILATVRFPFEIGGK